LIIVVCISFLAVFSLLAPNGGVPFETARLTEINRARVLYCLNYRLANLYLFSEKSISSRVIIFGSL
jgi:hypothetical protein